MPRYLHRSSGDFSGPTHSVPFSGLGRSPSSQSYSERRSRYIQNGIKHISREGPGSQARTCQLCRYVSDSALSRSDLMTLLTCVECRRSRLKCDREGEQMCLVSNPILVGLMCVVPCSSCVRRKCADLCPDGVKPSRRSYVYGHASKDGH